MSEQVYWVLQLQIHEGKEDAYRALMEEMVAATADEPGALNYEWSIADDGRTVHIFERYADSAATLTHLQNFGAFAKRFMGAADIKRFTVYGNPNAAAQKALTGAGARILAPWGGFSR